MASVWYIGKAGSRRVTSAQWAAAGIPAVSDSTWDAANGYSIPAASFTAGQLAILSGYSEFNINAPDTPRDPVVPEVATPGIETGIASRASAFTTNNTATGATDVASKIGGLQLSLVGDGRPQDLEFRSGASWHSVAGQCVIAYWIVNGVGNPAGWEFAQVTSGSTVRGSSLILRDRQILVKGQSYVIEVGICGGGAGTSNVYALPSNPMRLVSNYR